MDEARNKLKDLVDRGLLPMEQVALMLESINTADPSRVDHLRVSANAARAATTPLESRSASDRVSLAAAGVKRIKLDNKAGDVLICCREGDTIELVVERKVSATSAADAEALLPQMQLRQDREGDLVRWQVRAHERLAGVHHDANVVLSLPPGLVVETLASGGVEVRQTRGDLKITAAASILVREHRGKLTLRCRQGDIDAEALSGELDLSTESGHVRLRDVSGPLRAASHNGNVDLSQARGDLRLSLPSGDCHVHQVEGELQVRIGSGNLLVEAASLASLDAILTHGSARVTLAPPPESDITIRAKHGDVHLSLPPATCASVKLKSAAGSIQADVPWSERSGEGREIHGVIGGRAAARVAVAADQGNVRLTLEPA
jgi:hypothetical protein